MQYINWKYYIKYYNNITLYFYFNKKNLSKLLNISDFIGKHYSWHTIIPEMYRAGIIYEATLLTFAHLDKPTDSTKCSISPLAYFLCSAKFNFFPPPTSSFPGLRLRTVLPLHLCTLSHNSSPTVSGVWCLIGGWLWSRSCWLAECFEHAVITLWACASISCLTCLFCVKCRCQPFKEHDTILALWIWVWHKHGKILSFLRCFKLIKSDIKDFYNVTKDFNFS